MINDCATRPTRPGRLRRLKFLVLSAIVGCASGTRPAPDTPGPVASVSLSPDPDTVFVTASAQLSAIARDSAGVVLASVSFTWQSATPGVATVTGTGQVTGVAPGPASITATADGVTGNATVVVRAPAANSVVVWPTSDSVPAGSVVQLHATVFDTNAFPVPGVQVAWSSGNSGVASVGPTGRVTGVAFGTAAISATYNGIPGSAQLKVRSAFARNDSTRRPLMDMGANASYEGLDGGLYPGGNALPSAHRAAGIAFASQVVPLNTLGQPSGTGTIVLMSVGFSNATQEWCTAVFTQPCEPWSFMGQAAGDPLIRSTGLTILDGAKSAQTVDTSIAPTSHNFDRVRDSVLAPRGLTERQVQVIWFKVAHADPTVSLPRANADAFRF